MEEVVRARWGLRGGGVRLRGRGAKVTGESRGGRGKTIYNCLGQFFRVRIAFTPLQIYSDVTHSSLTPLFVFILFPFLSYFPILFYSLPLLLQLLRIFNYFFSIPLYFFSSLSCLLSQYSFLSTFFSPPASPFSFYLLCISSTSLFLPLAFFFRDIKAYLHFSLLFLFISFLFPVFAFT